MLSSYFRKRQIIFGVSILLLFLGTNRMININKVKKWPTAKGLILSHEIVEKNADHVADDPSNQGKVNYVNIIEYSYKLNNQEYRGSEISLEEREVKKKKALNLFDKYPVNKEVSVFYNPDNINESLLEVGVGFSTISLLFFGILSFFLFIFMVWKGYIEPKKR